MKNVCCLFFSTRFYCKLVNYSISSPFHFPRSIDMRQARVEANKRKRERAHQIVKCCFKNWFEDFYSLLISILIEWKRKKERYTGQHVWTCTSISLSLSLSLLSYWFSTQQTRLFRSDEMNTDVCMHKIFASSCARAHIVSEANRLNQSTACWSLTIMMISCTCSLARECLWIEWFRMLIILPFRF